VYALGIAAVATYSEVINVNELPDMVNSFNDVLSVPKEALKYVVPPALALSGSATLQILRMINHLQRKKLDAIRQIRENESTMRILEHAEAHAQKPYNICPNNKLEQIKETESTTDVRPAKNSMQRPITETQEEPDIAKGLRWHFKTNKRNTRGSEDKRKAIGIKNMIYAKAPRGAH
jgi:hypothetical protein